MTLHMLISADCAALHGCVEREILPHATGGGGRPPSLRTLYGLSFILRSPERLHDLDSQLLRSWDCLLCQGQMRRDRGWLLSHLVKSISRPIHHRGACVSKAFLSCLLVTLQGSPRS